MAVSKGVAGSAVLLGTAGLYLAYAGVKDVPLIDGLRDIARGKAPQGKAKFPYIPKIAEALADEPGTIGARSTDTGGSFNASEQVSVGGGIRVHKSIAANVSRMRTAAGGQGVSLTGGGYRSHLEQADARRRNGCTCKDDSKCCQTPTAPVGQSMHERGLAIDFDNCKTRNTKVYKWLAANAANYGLYNLPSEPWHWSTNGH